MAKKKSKRSKKAHGKDTKRAEKLRRKAAAARPKAAKKSVKKTAKKAAKRPKAVRKVAKKAASRRKIAKKKTAPKVAKKAAKPKRPAKSTPKAAKPIVPTVAPKAPTPVARVAPSAALKPPKPVAPALAPKVPTPVTSPAAPKPVTPSMPPKSAPAQAAPAPQAEPAFLGVGNFDPGVDRYYSMLAQNTRESHRLGTLQIDRILAGNSNDIVALAEKAHDIVNNWRNDVLSPETIKECQIEFATGDPFTCAHKWAQRSIDAAKARGVASPFGHWARAYIYKYQKQANQSAADYKTALGLPPKAFIGHVGRRRKDLIAEWLESLVYWARKEQLQKVVDKIESDVPPGAGKLEAWINWVKCFALHLLGKFEASNALYPDYLPDDRDVNLIIAANHARLGHEDLRQLHRKLFLEKDGNATWNAAKEIERSPFVDKAMRDFWHESVDKALRAPAAVPTQSI